MTTVSDDATEVRAPGGQEWQVTQDGFDPVTANTYETLLTVGNGMFGTRGTLEEGHLGEVSGTYLSGVYDSHDAAVIDLVNAPDWLSVEVRVDGVRLDVATCTVVEHHRSLDLSSGLLTRRTVFADEHGRRTRLESWRFASMADRELAALRVEVTPENHDSRISVRSSLDGRRRNLDRLPVYADGTVFDVDVQWEKWARSRHLRPSGRSADATGLYLQTTTIDSQIVLGYAARHLWSSTSPHHVVPSSEIAEEVVSERAETKLAAGETLRLDKLVAIATSRGGADVAGTARGRALVHGKAGFDASLANSRTAWAELWRDCDCRVDGDDEATHALRFSIYQLLIAANPNDPTVNIGAKSLTGEGYRGHVFWDTEVLMLPFFIYTRPETARTLLSYRHHVLPGARELAAEGGFRGARYPWESADTGREECPIYTNDGAHRFWSRDEEVHVSADVAFGVISYVEATGDVGFLLDQGAEMLFETSRFWVDRTTVDVESGRHHILQVMGPDEFHSHVDDNAFTNHLAAWSLARSADVYDELAQRQPTELARIAGSIKLERHEVDRWRELATGLRIEVDPAQPVIEQFAGYFARREVPITSWDDNDMPRYPEGYHHFNCEDTTLLKQPDVVMLLHMLPDEFDIETKRANFEFYEARTLHKSSLSPAIHAIMGLEVGDATRALQYFRRSALVDLSDNQGNTREGVHIASAGGTWQILVNGFGGFRVRHNQLTFNPALPADWERIHFRLHWRGRAVDVSLGHETADFTWHGPADGIEEITVGERTVALSGGQVQTVNL